MDSPRILEDLGFLESFYKDFSNNVRREENIDQFIYYENPHSDDENLEPLWENSHIIEPNS